MKTSIDGPITLSGPSMGSRWTARLAPLADMATADARLARAVALVDEQMSTWRPDSALMRLNGTPVGEWVSLPADLLTVLGHAQDIGRQSDGLFDIGVGRLVRAWGFGPARGAADPAAIRAHLGQPLPGVAALELAPGRARRLADVELDLSGIAKGYAVDLMAEALLDLGCPGFLVGLDGELRAHGLRPDGQPWAVALEEPLRDRRAARGMIALTDQAIATSGDYRHFVRLGNGHVGHSMNPRSGGPVNNRVASVSVLADRCWRADAWATVLLVLGETAGPAFARSRGLDAIFCLRDGDRVSEVIISGG